MFEQLLEPRRFLAVQITDVRVIISGTGDADSISVVALPHKLRITINGERSYIPVEQGMNPTIIVRGEDGDDSIRVYGSTHRCSIEGGAGDDVIVADGADDEIFGDEGDDRIKGRGGDDMIFGGTGDDSIRGGSGDDSIRGDAGDDTLRGDEGDDHIGGDGDIRGPSAGGVGTDDDVITGGDGNDYLSGFAGDDLIRGDAGNDVLNGFFGGGITAYSEGTDGDDRLLGGDGDDIIEGGWGNDTLVGGNGQDQLLEPSGQLYGGDGDDTLIALDDDNAPDTIDGGDGYDRARLKKGVDVVTNVERSLFA